MAKTLYVVMGTTGEYSDRSEWPVAAVEGEESAKQYVRALERQYQSIPPSLKEDRWKNREKVKALMTLDPQFDEDYTGTQWFFSEVPFVDAAALADILATASPS
jgi:hypothetical protein